MTTVQKEVSLIKLTAAQVSAYKCKCLMAICQDNHFVKQRHRLLPLQTYELACQGLLTRITVPKMALIPSCGAGLQSSQRAGSCQDCISGYVLPHRSALQQVGSILVRPVRSFLSWRTKKHSQHNEIHPSRRMFLGQLV